MRVFPISNWTELDIWQYIARENLALPPIYYSHKREVVRRKGLLVPVTPLTPKQPNEVSEELDVRFRTVGDISCTCPVGKKRDIFKNNRKNNRTFVGWDLSHRS